LDQDIKQHFVYREIMAISQVQHKNIVRYFACWIETVDPNMKQLEKAIKKVESRLRKEYRNKRNL